MFVTFEGIDGSGKTSVLEALAREMRAQGHTVLATREPGGSPLGLELRRIVLEHRKAEMTPISELFLFLADRAEHVHKVLLPALSSGTLVFCDRYTDSTLAYQGAARGLARQTLMELNSLASGGLSPDLTLLFDLPVETALSRIMQRKQKDGSKVAEGRFDACARAFHEEVRRAFLELAAEDPRFCVLDAAQPFAEVVRNARERISAELEGKRRTI